MIAFKNKIDKMNYSPLLKTVSKQNIIYRDNFEKIESERLMHLLPETKRRILILIINGT